MRYFGWIPTLAGGEIFQDLCREYISNSKKLAGNVRNYILDYLNSVLEWDPNNVIVIQKNLFDLRKSNNVIFLKFDDSCLLQLVAIAEGDLGKLSVSGLRLIAVAKIVFYKSDLIEIVLLSSKSSIDNHKICRQVFRIVRDVYHVHTHHSHQDVLLEPVYAKDIDDAKYKLLKQYLIKIVRYHKEIKSRVDMNFWHYFSIFKYKDAEDTVLQAVGEIIYGENFSEFYCNTQISRFRRARESLQVLHGRIKSKYFLLPIIISLPTAILLTIYYGSYCWLPTYIKHIISKNFIVPFFIGVTIFSLFAPVFVIILFTHISYIFKYGTVPWIKQILKKFGYKKYDNAIFKL